MSQVFRYINFVLKRNRGIILFSAIFIAAIQFFMIQFMSTIDMEPMRRMLMSFPPAIKALIGKDMLSKLSVEGSAAFAFTHPITFGLFSYLSISIPMKEITRSIELGEMEIMLSYPITRKKLISSIWISGFIMLFLVSLAAVLASILGLSLYHDSGSDVAFRMMQIGINLFTLFFFVFSFSMVIAVYFTESSKSTTLAVGMTAAAYLTMVLAQIWDKIEWTKRINFFNYFDPQQIINKTGNYLWQVLDLSILCIVMYFISIWLFERRDI